MEPKQVKFICKDSSFIHPYDDLMRLSDVITGLMVTDATRIAQPKNNKPIILRIPLEICAHSADIRHAIFFLKKLFQYKSEEDTSFVKHQIDAQDVVYIGTHCISPYDRHILSFIGFDIPHAGWYADAKNAYAACGNAQYVEYAYIINPHWSQGACAAIARGNSKRVLLFAHENGLAIDRQMYKEALALDRAELLTIIFTYYNRIIYDDYCLTIHVSIPNGSQILQMLIEANSERWLENRRSQLYEWAVQHLPMSPALECIEVLLKNDCPINSHVIEIIAQIDYVTLLAPLYRYGKLQQMPDMCDIFAKYRASKCLKFAHQIAAETGIKISAHTLHLAYKADAHECVRFICPVVGMEAALETLGNNLYHYYVGPDFVPDWVGDHIEEVFADVSS